MVEILDRKLSEDEIREAWRGFLMGEFAPFHRSRRAFMMLPSSPRCKVCGAPFHGVGGQVMKVIGRGPAKMNPTLCDMCEQFARKMPGGAEIPLSMLFADIRGSTTLAEQLGTAQFSALIARFYNAVTEELLKADALIDRLIGDEVVALFVPVLNKDKHAQVAIQAARRVLQATGHGSDKAPWVPVGVGIHTGTAFVGAVGTAGVSDITALGDNVNLTARLASLARAGEILISEATRAAAGLPIDGLEPRHLQLKGRAEPVDAWVMRVGSHEQAALPS